MLKYLSKTLLSIGFLCFAAAGIQGQTLLKDGKIPEDLTITLERTECFGNCPEYELTVTAFGNVFFVGRGFTKTDGFAQGKITIEQLREIIAEFENIKFFKLNNAYRSGQGGCRAVATDMPSQIISIRANGKTKKVEHYLGCFDLKRNSTGLLVGLGRKIDEITDSKRWIE